MRGYLVAFELLLRATIRYECFHTSYMSKHLGRYFFDLPLLKHYTTKGDYVGKV